MTNLAQYRQFIVQKASAFRLFFLATSLLLMQWGCPSSELPDLPGAAVPTQAELAEKITDVVKSKLNDYITCSEFSELDIDIDKLKEMLLNPDQIKLDDLLVKPADIGWASQFLGGSLESSILLSRNILFLLESGHFPTLVSDGWDGLNCDGSIELQCVSGNAVSTVVCAGTSPTGIEFTFSDCVRSGKTHRGKVIVDSGTGASSAVHLGFEDYYYSDNGQILGEVVFDIDSTDDLSFSLQAEKELQVVAYGGPSDDAPSCASRLSLTTLGLSVEDEQGVLAVEGSRETMDGTFGLKTIQDDLWWPSSTNCFCPGAGSGVEFDFPRPLGRTGDVAKARVVFQESQQSHLCAEASVTMLDWPSDCSFVESPTSDCAKGATERMLGHVLSALCISFD